MGVITKNIVGQSNYRTSFKAYICSACGLCTPILPIFCASVYAGNQKRFLNIVKCIRVALLTNPKGLLTLYSFEGFCGLFCNSYPQCPNRSSKCKELSQAYQCYEAFVNQCGASIPKQVKSDIWEMFSGINTNLIGKSCNIFTAKPLKSLKKVKRKEINRIIEKARANIHSAVIHKSKPVKTSNKRCAVAVADFFYNDNKEWGEKIEFYLGKDETNK
jgi:hypothetical protein